MQIKRIPSVFFLLILSTLVLIKCKKPDTVTPLTNSTITGSGNIDVSWTFDKPHGNVNWETKYYDFSNTMLTGKFNNFGFTPKFIFNEANLSATSIHFWVQLSTFNSGEIGRDGPGKCGRSYLGVTYLDTNKTVVDPTSDTAWFHGNSIVKSGNGYVVKGNFSLNRYRTPSGYPDKTPITHPITVFLTYNGMSNFDTDGDGNNDKYRAGLSANFSFKRSDYMDTNATVQWVPVPNLEDITNNAIAANNKTYGAWSYMVGDEMKITINAQFYKNY